MKKKTVEEPVKKTSKTTTKTVKTTKAAAKTTKTAAQTKEAKETKPAKETKAAKSQVESKTSKAKEEPDQDVEFAKLFLFIKDKKVITWDEINDVVGVEFATQQMDKIISMMEKSKVVIQEIEPDFVNNKMQYLYIEPKTSKISNMTKVAIKAVIPNWYQTAPTGHKRAINNPETKE